MNNYIIRCENIIKKYSNGKIELTVLKGISISIKKNESVVITGPSGAGKSTLLHVLGLMDKPTSGVVFVDGLDCNSSESTLAKFRNESIGFVFQFYNLLPEFTAIENVMFPLLISGEKEHTAKKKAQQLIAEVGLLSRASHLSSELSGGEQQRVAIARALINSPKILIADEPTGNLDRQTGENVINLIMQLQSDYGFTLLIATHNEAVANRCTRIIKLVDGQIEAGNRK
ncbi:MAG: ABC transporter ATP-binding protein [Elusimicrobiota bacterium]